MTTYTNRSAINPAEELWREVMADKAECERREAARAKPQPVITPCLLIVFAVAVYIVGLVSGVLV